MGSIGVREVANPGGNLLYREMKKKKKKKKKKKGLFELRVRPTPERLPTNILSMPRWAAHSCILHYHVFDVSGEFVCPIFTAPILRALQRRTTAITGAHGDCHRRQK